MDKRAHNRAAAVHGCAAEVEATHWLATGSTRPCALTMHPGARLPVLLSTTVHWPAVARF